MKDDEWFSYHEGRRTAEKHRLADLQDQNRRDRTSGSQAHVPGSASARAPAGLNAREQLFWLRNEILDQIRKCRDLSQGFKDDWSRRLKAIDMFGANADEQLRALASEVIRAASEEERSHLRGTSSCTTGLLGATMSLIGVKIEALARESGNLSRSGG